MGVLLKAKMAIVIISKNKMLYNQNCIFAVKCIVSRTRPGGKFSPGLGPGPGSGKYLTPEPGPGPGSKHFTSRGRSRGRGDRKHRGPGPGPGLRIFLFFFLIKKSPQIKQCKPDSQLQF